MKKETREFLENCTKQGIISEVQKKQAVDFDKAEIEKREKMIKNCLNITVTLMAVFLMFAGMLIVYQKFNYINPTFKLVTSGALVAVSLYGIARSKVNRNYFLLEAFVSMNICVVLTFLVSNNMETVFRYRADSNSFITAFAMFPVFLVTRSYISFIVYCSIFLLSSAPEFNLAITTIPNSFFELVITGMYLGLLVYKFMKLYRNGKSEYMFNDYFSNHIILVFLEVLILAYIFKFCYIGSGKIDVGFIYLIMCWNLVRHTSYFRRLVQTPVVVDIILFFSIIYIFLVSEPFVYSQSIVLLYHSLYYMVVIFLKQKGSLDNTSTVFKIQQHFYINMFIFVFTIHGIIDTIEVWFIITIILGLFNSFIGVKYKSVIQSIIGFGIILAALLFTTLRVPSTLGGLMFVSAGIVVLYISRDVIREVLKGYE